MPERPRRRLTIRGMLVAILLIGLGLGVTIQSFRAEQAHQQALAMAEEAEARRAVLAALQAARPGATTVQNRAESSLDGSGEPGAAEVPVLQQRIRELEQEVTALRRELGREPARP